MQFQTREKFMPWKFHERRMWCYLIILISYRNVSFMWKKKEYFPNKQEDEILKN